MVSSTDLRTLAYCIIQYMYAYHNYYAVGMDACCPIHPWFFVSMFIPCIDVCKCAMLHYCKIHYTIMLNLNLVIPSLLVSSRNSQALYYSSSLLVWRTPKHSRSSNSCWGKCLQSHLYQEQFPSGISCQKNSLTVAH